MSAAMMSIPADALHLRNMLFDLSKPVTISPKEFNTVWPYIDSVYTKLQSGAAASIWYTQIYHAVRGAGTHEGSERLEELGGSSLKRQDIVIQKRGTKSSDLRSLPHGKLFQDDVLQAYELLTEREWLFEELQIIDKRENGEIIAEGLKHIEKWCSGKWQPRYIMTDDSAIEQRAIHLAFPGLDGGEQEVAHLLCSVHSNRALLRRLGSNANKPIYQLLKHAMYCFTQIQNRALCEQAVAAATAIDNTGNIANYVQTYWLQTASRWVIYNHGN
ncbi:hypothetical protein L211DRAFT_866481 [Terfezia boudieri ATCC MYA-4762]|uniref:MULE transposase domain-containing protein n=1 Tax=Terfezia boudieri ATCC MYA-4762 TaxID=1051890 RepID=A0A3N4LT42_9PEZI|nr:hypothetical protein L211DRAFT_866481 [Terfezia boudieri ATCC MYA-4762]